MGDDRIIKKPAFLNIKLIQHVLTAAVTISLIGSLTILVSYWTGFITIQHVNSLNILLGGLQTYFFSIGALILAGLFFWMIVELSRWFSSKEGIVVQPFKVGGFEDNKINGFTIADLLIRELLRIRNVNNIDQKTQLKSTGSKQLKSKLTPITPGGEDINVNIANLGTLNQGPLNLSIGQLLITLKKITRTSPDIITGSIQNHQDSISLIAWMAPKEAKKSWESKYKPKGKIYEAKIPEMVRDIAYQISFEITPANKRNADTLSGFKNHTEALYNYYWYQKTREKNYLNESQEKCFNTLKVEPRHADSASLLYNLGIIYLNENKYKDAEKMFKNAHIIKPKDKDILIGYGLTLNMLEKNRKAIKHLDIAIKEIRHDLENNTTSGPKSSALNKKLLKACTNKSIVLFDLNENDKALSILNKLLKKDIEDKIRGYIYYNKGFILYTKIKSEVLNNESHPENLNEQYNDLNEKYQEVVKCLSNAAKLDFDPSMIDYMRGNICHDVGNYEEAQKYLDKAIEQNPKYANAWNKKGKFLREKGEYKKALECYNIIINLEKSRPAHLDFEHSTNLNLVRSSSLELDYGSLSKGQAEKISLSTIFSELDSPNPYINKSYTLSALGRYKEAVRCLKKVIEDNSNTLSKREKAHILTHEGCLSNIIGKYKEAIKYCDEAIKISPNNSEAWLNKGYALMKSKKYWKAKYCFDKAIKINPKDIKSYKDDAIASCQMGDKKESKRISNQLIKQNPKNPTYWIAKSNILNDAGFKDEAFESIKYAISLDNKNPRAWKQKSLLLYSNGEKQKAINCLEKAISIAKDIKPKNYHEYWFSKGFFLNEMKQYEEAIDCYKTVIQLNPDNPRAWNNLGYSYYRIGERDNLTECFNRAINCYNKATTLNPENKQFWINKSFALNKMKKYENTLICHDKLIDIDSKDPIYWSLKGDTLQNMGECETTCYKESINCYNKVIELRPRDKDISKDAWNKKGQVLAELGKYKDALKCFNKVIQQDHANESALANKAKVLAKLKNYKESLKTSKHTLTVNPKNAIARYHKCISLKGLRKCEDAMECFDKALEIEHDSKLLYNKCIILKDLGKNDEAQACFDELLEWDSECKPAQKAREELKALS